MSKESISVIHPIFLNSILAYCDSVVKGKMRGGGGGVSGRWRGIPDQCRWARSRDTAIWNHSIRTVHVIPAYLHRGAFQRAATGFASSATADSVGEELAFPDNSNPPSA